MQHGTENAGSSWLMWVHEKDALLSEEEFNKNNYFSSLGTPNEIFAASAPLCRNRRLLRAESVLHEATLVQVLFKYECAQEKSLDTWLWFAPHSSRDEVSIFTEVLGRKDGDGK